MTRHWFGHKTNDAAAAMPAGRVARKSVLFIDEQPESLVALCHALADEPLDWETADSAPAALGKLMGHQHDVIVLDSRMAAVDGRRLTRLVLTDEALAAVPVVNVASGEPAAETLFDATLARPVDRQAVAETLRRILKMNAQVPVGSALDLPPQATGGNRRRAAARYLSAIEAGLPESQFAPANSLQLELLAEQVAAARDLDLRDCLLQAARLAGAGTTRSRARFRSAIRLSRELAEQPPDDGSGMAELRVKYLENRRADLDTLDFALRNQDFAALRQVGHNIKGTGASYGFAELTDLGRALEAAAEQADAATAEALLDRVESYIAIAQPAIF